MGNSKEIKLPDFCYLRISARIQELSACSEENPDYTDIELIQHIDLDVNRLTKLLTEAIQKFKMLKKSAHLILLSSLEKAIWNWIEFHPKEFEELQQNPNEDLSKCCENFFDILDSYSENKKSRLTVSLPKLLKFAEYINQ